MNQFKQIAHTVKPASHAMRDHRRLVFASLILMMLVAPGCSPVRCFAYLKSLHNYPHDQVRLPRPAYNGYYPTCWRPWQEGWKCCPVYVPPGTTEFPADPGVEIVPLPAPLPKVPVDHVLPAEPVPPGEPTEPTLPPTEPTLPPTRVLPDPTDTPESLDAPPPPPAAPSKRMPPPELPPSDSPPKDDTSRSKSQIKKHHNGLAFRGENQVLNGPLNTGTANPDRTKPLQVVTFEQDFPNGQLPRVTLPPRQNLPQASANYAQIMALQPEPKTPVATGLASSAASKLGEVVSSSEVVKKPGRPSPQVIDMTKVPATQSIHRFKPLVERLPPVTTESKQVLPVANWEQVTPSH